MGQRCCCTSKSLNRTNSVIVVLLDPSIRRTTGLSPRPPYEPARCVAQSGPLWDTGDADAVR